MSVVVVEEAVDGGLKVDDGSEDVALHASWHIASESAKWLSPPAISVAWTTASR